MRGYAQTCPHLMSRQKRVSFIWTLPSAPTLWTISALFLTCIVLRVLTWGFPNSAIANQESLSGLETEMRKLEGIVKEIVEELDYLKRREERFQITNGPFSQRALHIVTAPDRNLVSTNLRV